jgi:chromosome segregation ATPase
MNNKTFNPSQSTMKKNGVNYKDDNISSGMMNKDIGINSSNSASLKGKLTTLEESIEEVKGEMTQHKSEVSQFKAEKDSIQEMLKTKTHEVKESLINELLKVEEEMKRHFSHQKAENSRLQQQISQLKTEKTVLSSQLLYLKRRIEELELQVGNDDMKV